MTTPKILSDLELTLTHLSVVILFLQTTILLHLKQNRFETSRFPSKWHHMGPIMRAIPWHTLKIGVHDIHDSIKPFSTWHWPILIPLKTSKETWWNPLEPHSKTIKTSGSFFHYTPPISKAPVFQPALAKPRPSFMRFPSNKSRCRRKCSWRLKRSSGEMSEVAESALSLPAWHAAGLWENNTRSDDYDSWLLQMVQNYGNYGGNHWFGHPHKRHENVEAWWNMWNVSVKSNKSESVGTQQLLLVLSLNPFQNIQHKSHWKL